MAKQTIDWSGYAGKGLNAFGALYEGFSQARSLKAQAKQVEKQAQQTRRAGIADQIAFNEETRRTIGTQRQLYGQAGVRLEGAPEELMAATKRARVEDRMTMARNTKDQYDSLMADAKALRKAANSAKTAAVISAFTSFF